MKNLTKNIVKNITTSMFLFLLISLLVKCVLFTGIVKQYSITALYGVILLSYTRIPYYLGFIILFLCFSYLFPNKKSHFIYLLLVDTIISFLFLIDIWYFRGFGTMPSVMALQQIGNLDNLSGSIIALIKPIDFLLVIDFIFIGFIYGKTNYQRKTIKFFINLSVSLFLVLHIPFASKYLGIKDKAAIFSLLDSNITAFNLSPIGYHVVDAYYYLKDSSTMKLTENGKREIKTWYEKNEKTCLMSQPLKNKNLIVLQLESFENFVVGLKIDNQEVTPNLNKLLFNSYRFTNVYEQVKEGTTSDAEFMLNTSLYPLQKGSVFFRYPINKFPSLPETLEKHGYSTISMHPDSGSYWNWKAAHKSIGFDQQLDYGAWDQSEQIGMGLSDISFLRQAAGKIAEQEKPFYSFLVSLSSHSPFKIPEKDIGIKIPEKLKGTTMGRYIEAVNYTDRAVGVFVQELKEKGLMNDSILVIYGDHEGVHKYNGDEEATKLYTNNKTVPLIIYSPSIKAREIGTIGGQIDIMPTVLSLLGCEKPAYAMGRDLFTSKQSFAALMNGKVIGKVDDTEIAHIKEGVIDSDKIIESNFLAKEVQKIESAFHR